MHASGEKIGFGPFSLDLAATRLRREGVALDLRPQVFEALKTLVVNSGRYVDYDQMISEAWHGTVVSKHTVAVTVGEVKEALKEFGSWINYRPKLGYRLEVPHSDHLIRKGWHFWTRSTREGFEKALDCFQQAAIESDTDVRAYKGISVSYLMLGAYGMRPPTEMYDGFREAHDRAVALGGLTPELRADRAHALHVFERKFADAESELLQSLHDDPRIATVCQSLAMLYSTSRRFEEAREVLDQARLADALLPTVSVTEVFVRFCEGDFEGAVAYGKAALELHPYLPLGRALYAQALEYSGRLEEALEQSRLACLMAPDLVWLRVQEGACLAKLGRRMEASSVLEQLQETRATEYVDAYEMSMLYDALGRRDDAIHELERAVRENSALLFMLDVDPKMDPLRGDPRFESIRNRLFGKTAAPARVVSAA